jgi:hypothetical protein
VGQTWGTVDGVAEAGAGARNVEADVESVLSDPTATSMTRPGSSVPIAIKSVIGRWLPLVFINKHLFETHALDKDIRL